jgi:outer membrane protein assembly factor BamB
MNALCLLLLPCAGIPVSEDWPAYRGPNGDGSASGALAQKSFPAGGPSAAWKVPLGAGFSSFAIGGGKAYTLVLREVDGAAREVCLALDAESGRELWATPLGQADYDGGGDSGTDDNKGGDGPRSTPSLAGGRVYVLDANLVLSCLDAGNGVLSWKRDLIAEHEGRQIPWQNAASPLVEGGRVFVAGGGEDQSLLAFDAASGALAWASGDEKMTHATPVAATLHGQRQVLFFVQSGLIAVEPESGEPLWRVEFPYRTSTAASPVVHGDIVYCSAGYGVGAAAWRIARKGDAFTPELLWRTPNKLMNHWSTPVARDGHLYGMFSFKEYGDGPVQCIELATGAERWSQPGFGPGNCILVGGELVALSDAGELVLIEARPDAYRELARADVLAGKCWSTPAFSDGSLYVRSTSEGTRLELSDAGGSGQ